MYPCIPCTCHVHVIYMSCTWHVCMACMAANISKIVKKTALEFNLPYNEYRTTRDAIKSHFNFLKLMGTKPAL